MIEPKYYAENGLSPLKAYEQGLLSKEEYVGFLKGNIIKYTIRAGKKEDDPLLDIVKAMDYLHYLHQALKDEEVEPFKLEFKTPKDLSELDKLKKDIHDFKKSYIK